MEVDVDLSASYTEHRRVRGRSGIGRRSQDKWRIEGDVFCRFLCFKIQAHVRQQVDAVMEKKQKSSHGTLEWFLLPKVRNKLSPASFLWASGRKAKDPARLISRRGRGRGRRRVGFSSVRAKSHV